LCQVVVVSGIHMVYVQIAHTFILHTTILAGHVPSATDISAEELPSRASSEFGTFFCI
jgi:hypothetical protein